MLARTLALLALCAPVAAQFSDDFEGYAPGSAIEGQGGWQNWDSINQGNQTINTVENAPPVPHSGDRMLRVVGSGNPNCSGCSDSIHQLGGPYTSGQWTFRVYQYLPLSYSGDQWVMLLNDWSDGGVGPFNWSMAVHMDSNTSTCVSDISAAANPVATGGTQSLIYDEWVEIKAEIDLDADTCEVYYGGVSMFTFTWSVGSSNGTLAEIEILDIFAFENDSEVFYDDVSLTTGIGSSVSVVCDPAMDHSGGTYTNLDTSTWMPPTGSLSGLHLEATSGPPGEFGYFLVSAGAGSSFAVSNGILCLDSPQGRYAPGAGVSALNSIGSFNASGVFESIVQAQQGWDVPTGLPTPPGGVVTGGTWYFQMWYRDGQRSNFSNAICVTF